jgi:UDP-N-acetylglucosamine:LPS N-acetylglucosamine transferase
MALPKRVLILTADAGFGHRAAANAVAEALGERYGEDCSVVIVNPLQEPRASRVLRLAQDDYDRMIRESPGLYRLGYEASDSAFPVSIAEQALIAMLYATMRDIVEAHQPDAIVSTYPLYQAPLAALFALAGRYTPLLVVVTDLVSVHSLWFNDDVDRCLVPTQVVFEKALENRLVPECIEITGLPVSPALAREVDKAALRSRLGFAGDRILALMAGSKRVTKLEPVVDVLDHCGWPLEFALVAGGDKDLEQRWSVRAWHQPAHVYDYVDDMPSLMLAADLIVCKAGGLIVSEALAAGLPLLLVQALPGQEVGNAAYVIEGDAGVLAADPLEALITVCHWLENGGKGLAERAARARALGRPQASFRVAELAWQAAQQGPIRREHRFGRQIPLLEQILRSRDLIRSPRGKRGTPSQA